MLLPAIAPKIGALAVSPWRIQAETEGQILRSGREPNEGHAMNLRRAIPSDAAVLRYWDTKAHVIAASGDEPCIEWETELARRTDWGEWLIAEADGRPIGALQIIDPALEESHYWGDVETDLRAIDIWIGEEEDLGRGFGTEMMRLALARCFADAAVKAVLLDPLVSNGRVHPFYERLGFRKTGRRMFGDDDCFVYRLDRDVWRTG
jgi:aminoglycoside 6'-N-acetyltransferase